MDGESLKPLDLDALEKVARAATQSEWRHPGSRVGGDASVTEGGRVLASVHPRSMRYAADGADAAERDANAAHIAAFDPPTVLALIAAARRSPAVGREEIAREIANGIGFHVHRRHMHGREDKVILDRASVDQTADRILSLIEGKQHG